MGIASVLLLVLAAFGISVYASVRGRAALAGVAAAAFLLLAVVWAGETFDFWNV